MNRILIDNNQINYDGENSILINDTKEKLVINVNKQTTLNIFILKIEKTIEVNVDSFVKAKINVIKKMPSNKVVYNLNENSKLIVNKLSLNNSDEVTINLNKEKAEVTYNYSAINYEVSNYKIDIKHNSRNTISNIYNHALSMSDKKVFFDVNGYVYKNSSKCICNQDNKIIYLNENLSSIKPNLFIENYDVSVNHAAYIGAFKRKELFYLMSRGIKEEDCYKLFRKSFVLGKMILDNDEKKVFEEELKNMF